MNERRFAEPGRTGWMDPEVRGRSPGAAAWMDIDGATLHRGRYFSR